ncbi:MAG: DASS family sodium-coupled anion symporter [Gemmatimonadaceae bacterium]
MTDDTRNVRARLGLLCGPVLCVATLLVAGPESLSAEAWRATGVGLLMATWWITEAVPIPVTALLPLLLFPVLGVMPVAEAAAPYANPVIFLFLGGFIIAAALAQCGLHRRMALATIGLVGTRPANLVAGFMVATAFISMWVSNTATIAMMFPMAMSVIALAERDARVGDAGFAIALLLGLAYAANIGGLGTLIGTPPNALLAGFVAETYGREIGFAQWMLLGVPIVVVALPIVWLILVKWLYPLPRDEITGGREAFRAESAALGPPSRAEWTVGAITLVTAASWVARPLIERVVPGLSDASIAIGGAILMFLVPVERGRLTPALRWEDAERLPWSVLILFGGGLSLAHALSTTGMAAWLGNSMTALVALPVVVIIVAITAVVLFLTELTSNTATAAVFLPIAGSLAIATGHDPFLFVIPAALAASCAFMMPVATPPNAIVFASGRLTIPQMATAGVWINLAMLALINVFVFLLATRVFGAARVAA